MQYCTYYYTHCAPVSVASSGRGRTRWQNAALGTRRRGYQAASAASRSAALSRSGSRRHAISSPPSSAVPSSAASSRAAGACASRCSAERLRAVSVSEA